MTTKVSPLPIPILNITKLACFECGSIEYLVKECPKKKKEYYKKNNKKQAMVTNQSHSKGSGESENEEGQAHLCIIGNSDKEDELEENSKEVLDFLNTCSKDNWLELFSTCFKLNKS